MVRESESRSDIGLSGGKFVVIKGPDLGKYIFLGERPILIGSSSICDFVLSDKTVSRRHVVAMRAGEQVVVRDQESRNGSFFRGQTFQEIVIGYEDEFRVGRSLIKYLPGGETVEVPIEGPDRFGSLQGREPKMRQLFKFLQGVAQTDATVLLEGETGTGKELIAEEIHKHSPRRGGPFIVFDCGAVPPNLVESALFGHVKGAFTGAVANRPGVFREADGGSIFLDEIGELPLELQPSLLRAIDRRAICPVGSNRYEEVSVRIIAATHRDLKNSVRAKTFREDLYFRLAVIRVKVPSLRERPLDIELLSEHFIRQFSRGRPLRIPPAILEKLRKHPWPGNVRELRNVIERACVLSPAGVLTFEGFGDGTRPTVRAAIGMPYKDAKKQQVEHFERDYFGDLMRRHSGNVSAAAREAKMDRKHLRDIIRKYGFE